MFGEVTDTSFTGLLILPSLSAPSLVTLPSTLPLTSLPWIEIKLNKSLRRICPVRSPRPRPGKAGGEQGTLGPAPKLLRWCRRNEEKRCRRLCDGWFGCHGRRERPRTLQARRMLSRTLKVDEGSARVRDGAWLGSRWRQRRSEISF